VIVGSGVIAFLNAGSQSMFDDQRIANISLGIGSLVVGILNTMGTYFGWAKRAEGHRISAIHYAKLYRFINVEMRLPREQRMQPGDFLKYTKDQYDRLAEIDRLAPADYELQNGKRHQVIYEPGQPPTLAVRIQELFGVAETPRIAGGRVPVLLHLLGPNHRPQQVTSDLASFWKNTYPTVKKELRRRYPKHSWPDDPLALKATRSGLKRDE
jgi:hypothetical protein